MQLSKCAIPTFFVFLLPEPSRCARARMLAFWRRSFWRGFIMGCRIPTQGVGAPSRPWTLSGHVRKRLRLRPVMSRADLRADLRQARLLAYGCAGAARLREVLAAMARAGEVRLVGPMVEATQLRPCRPRSTWRPPRRRPLKQRMRAIRERRIARRKAPETAGTAKPVNRAGGFLCAVV